MTRTFPLIALTTSIALLGFGCRPPATPEPIAIQNAPIATEEVAVPTPTDSNTNEPHVIDQEGPSAEGLIARQALKNLSLAKTYRTTMTVPTANGIMKTSASINRDQGMLGRLEIPTGQEVKSAEIYIANNVILFRENNGSWNDISTTEEGKQFTSLFSNVLTPNSPDTSLVISDNARTVEIKDDPSGCKLYVLSQVNEAGERVPYNICIKNDIPTYVSIQTAVGILTTTYTDINGSVDIQRPQ